MFEDICFDLVYRTLLTMYYSKALLLSAQAQQPLHCTVLSFMSYAAGPGNSCTMYIFILHIPMYELGRMIWSQNYSFT